MPSPARTWLNTEPDMHRVEQHGGERRGRWVGSLCLIPVSRHVGTGGCLARPREQCPRPASPAQRSRKLTASALCFSQAPLNPQPQWLWTPKKAGSVASE